MTHRVLVSAPYFQPVVEEYRPTFARHGVELVVPRVEERLSEDDLLPLVGDIDGVICGDDGFTPRVFENAPRLKVIAKWGTGIDSIDRAAAERHGVRVCNTVDAFTGPVADTVMGYVLSFARRLHEMDRAMKAGHWEKIPGASLGERTLGVIGVGHIGRAVVRRATAFGMTVLGHDVVDIDPSFVLETGISMVAKPELFERSDFVTINCDLNPTSRGLIDGEALGAMKPTAFLINTARGPIVDQAALVTALRAGEIAGAALDVYEDEPLPADSPLRAMDNCLLAPHNANSSPSAWRRVHENTVANLLEGLGVAPRGAEPAGAGS